jgi:hypothetical protein
LAARFFTSGFWGAYQFLDKWKNHVPPGCFQGFRRNRTPAQKTGVRPRQRAPKIKSKWLAKIFPERYILLTNNPDDCHRAVNL